MFTWNVYGMPGALALALGWVLAALVYQAAPGRPQNRRLALLIVLEASFMGTGAGLMYLAAAPAEAFALQIVCLALIPVAAAAYLSFLAILDTPLTRALRPVAVRGALFALALAGAAVVVARPFAFVAGTVRLPTGDYEAVLTLLGMLLFLGPLLPLYLYALTVALLAVRAAPRGSARRRKAAWFAIAFGLKDFALAASLVLFVLLPDPVILHAVSVGLGATAVVAFALLLAYALLREQVLDIDLKLKWTLSRGTIAGVFIATFFVATEAAQEFLGARTGSAYVGTVAAGALVFALSPLQRFADRVSSAALPHVEDTPEYRHSRKREIYRAAYESALQDGEVTRKERDVLATLASEMGLTPRDVLRVEREAAPPRSLERVAR